MLTAWNIKSIFFNFRKRYYTFSWIVSHRSIRGVMEAKTAGIIVIGDEVLKGQVADQNVHFLAKKLHLLGIKLCKVSVVPDVVEDIAKEVSEYSSKYDRVITTGGIGPTHDDVTYEGIAAAFQDTLVLNDELLSYWTWFNKDPAANKESSIKMATIPKSASVIYTKLTKSVINAEKFPVVTVNNVCVFPGIPFYLKAIFNALQGSYFVPSGVMFHVRRLYLVVYESVFSSQLTETAKMFEKTVVFGSYPKLHNAEYKTLITVESQDLNELCSAIEHFRNSLKSEWIASNGDVLSEAWNITNEYLNYETTLGRPFIDCLTQSIQIVEKVHDDYQPDEIFLAFNGGKDCTALLHLAYTVRNKREVEQNQVFPPITAVYFKPSNALPEMESFIYQTARKYNINLITEEGPIKDTLNRLTKMEIGKKWKVVLMGTRKADPIGAKLRYLQKTDDGWANLVRVSALLDWSYKDVWTYLRSFSVAYCSLYDDGYTSLDDSKGCERNPSLKYICSDGQIKYKPAYTLEDESTERSGRQ